MTSPHDDTDATIDLLTAYALDALEPDEVAQVVALLEERPELRGTLAELRAAAGRLPYALPEAEPPPELRQRVLDYATGRAAPTRPAPAGIATRARVWLLSLGGIAAAALLAAAIGWAQATGAQTELARVRAELDAARLEQQQVAEVLSRAETMAALTGSEGSGAILRTPQGQALLAARLPPLQPGRVYQLWMIQGDTPASAGTFTVSEQGHGVLALAPAPEILAATTFAVTNEPGPSGSPGPTTDPLIVGSAPS
jgi:anti-sigma-K factor RskA